MQFKSFALKVANEPDLTIAGLGDSLTDGWMVQQGFFDRFIDLFQEHYTDKQIRSANFGVPGSTAGEAISRVPAIVAQTPDLVVVQFGLNDCNVGVDLDSYLQHLSLIVAGLDKKFIASVLVTSCQVNDPFFLNRVDAYYEMIMTAGNRLDVPVIRLDRYWQHHATEEDAGKLLQADGVHPTDAGHALMAKGLFEGILKLIN